MPGSFAEGVLRRGHPDLIATVRRLVPYPRQVQEALDALLETLDGAIPELPADTHGAGFWRASAACYVGRRWVDVPFLWAESHFYRLMRRLGYLLVAVRPAPGRVDRFEQPVQPISQSKVTAYSLVMWWSIVIHRQVGNFSIDAALTTAMLSLFHQMSSSVAEAGFRLQHT